MLRLAHRILSTPAETHLPYEAASLSRSTYEEIIGAARANQQNLRSAEVVIADDVAELHLRNQDEQKEDWPERFRSPFRVMFVEYVTPAVVLAAGNSSRGKAPVQQTGVLVSASRIDVTLRAMRNLPPDKYSSEMIGRLESLRADSDEVLFASTYFAVGGRAVLAARNCLIGLRKDGTLAGMSDLSAEVHPIPPKDWLGVAALTMGFLACRNVEAIDATGTHGPGEKWQRRQKVPALTYRTLKVNPFGATTRRTDGEPGEEGKALHLVRGHFSTYTEDKPLFGRPGLHGQFWVPQHARGDAKLGGVVKDYRVVTPGSAMKSHSAPIGVGV